MASNEQAVRDAALALQNAIADAVADGYRVEWPGSAADLDKIAISETAKVEQPLPQGQQRPKFTPKPGEAPVV